MTTRDDVLRVIRGKPGVTALKIARELFGPDGKQQSVNGICGKLLAEGKISRKKEQGIPYTYYHASNVVVTEAFDTAVRKTPVTSNKKNNIVKLTDLLPFCKNALFVIPCCKNKTHLGVEAPVPSSYKSAELQQYRIRALAKAGGTINLAGSEFNIQKPVPLYRPAHERYIGYLYSVEGVPALLQRRNDIRIMSALYGLLECKDHIQDYNLEMSTVHTIWRDILPKTLSEAAKDRKATVIIGLLAKTTKYASVFRQLAKIKDCPPSYLVSVSDEKSQRYLCEGLGHALLYLHGQGPLPNEFAYEINRVDGQQSPNH